ncbi:hypothetical protein BHM03_00054318 [Ensete ventricosum]|nr:hypothetical protein BHM03_00054318 [Ensete ventricosum]
MRGQSSEFPEFIGAGSSFSKKDALTPLAPSTPSSPPLPLRRQRLPLPTDNRPAKGRPHLWSAPLPLLATGLATGDSPLGAPCSQPPLWALGVPASSCRPWLAAANRARRRRPCGLLPLRAASASLADWLWPQPVAPLLGALPRPGCGGREENRRFLSRPSGDSVLVVIVPSSSALGDSRTVIALAVMRSYFNVDSIVTTHRLVEVRKNYFIPLEYELHVPLPRERPYDTSQCGFSLSTDALEAGLRFSLYPVIEACLEQWRISPSQMVPNSWWYMVAFLWECHMSNIRATRELFMASFRLSQGQAKYYLATRGGFRVSCRES